MTGACHGISVVFLERLAGGEQPEERLSRTSKGGKMGRRLSYLVAVLALAASADLALSSYWTCVEQGHRVEQSCTMFRGPLLSLARYLFSAAEGHHGAIVALFTV